MTITLKLSSITKYFGYQKQFSVIIDANLEIKKGEIVALVGSSGSGKSTLLQIAGLLSKPTSGNISINGIDCTNANDKKRTYLRRNFLGFVYQFHHLLQEFSIIENVMLPQIILGHNKIIAQKNAETILEKIGLQNKKKLLISQISGGERQRVAIARGLINNPDLFLADEPTGNLDPENALIIFSLLKEYAKEKNISVFLVTHNNLLAEQADTVITLSAGILLVVK